jgi:hypothetical protein
MSFRPPQVQSAEGCEDMPYLHFLYSIPLGLVGGMPRRRGREKLEINPMNQGRLLHGG